MNDNIYDDLKTIIDEKNIKRNEPMNKHTSFKVGGNADYFIEVSSKEKLIKIIEYLKSRKINIIVIGNGTNIIVSDKGIRGIVIKYSAKGIKLDGENIYAESGVSNAYLAQELLKNSITGFEFASGIPGSIGGAIAMNAGCYGSEFKDIVKKVTFIDLQNAKLYTIENNECKFSYRTSLFLNKKCIITDAEFTLKKGNKDNIKNLMDEYKEKRINSQPLEYPNAGSTFKRGNDFITAKLIDEAGLKGYSIGGAEVSTKHAGFIINKNNATANDIKSLIDFVKKTIYEKYNVKIEEEVRFIGE